MDKKADSKDPLQQNLRNSKKEWNKEMSVLIAQLIAMKQAINGRGNAKAGLPPSDIKNPFPNEVESYLDNIISNFNSVYSDAKSIIDQQAHYSENRRKPIQAFYNYKIKKTASNPFTRMISYLWKSPFSDDVFKQKTRLLSLTADFEKTVNEIEVILTSGRSDAIAQSFYNYMGFVKGMKTIFHPRLNDLISKQLKLSVLTKNIKEKDDEDEPITNFEQEAINDENIKYYISDINDYIDEIHYIIFVAKKYLEEGKINTTKEYLNDLKYKATNLLNETNEYDLNEKLIEIVEELSKVFNLEADKLSELYYSVSKLNKQASLKFARKNIHRALNRLKLNILPNEEERSRLDTANSLNKLYGLLQELMDLLQSKESSLQDILIKVSEIYLNISKTSTLFSYLGDLFNFSIKKEKLQHNKVKHPIISETYINFLKNTATKEFDGLAANMVEKIQELS
jgi:hypothetical protein